MGFLFYIHTFKFIDLFSLIDIRILNKQQRCLDKVKHYGDYDVSRFKCGFLYWQRSVVKPNDIFVY